MCSGAILSSRNVLTTATCVQNLLPADVQVYVGSNKYYSGGSTFNVANILRHPNFSSSSFESNLAILRVATSFVFGSTVQPIPLASVAPPNNGLVIATAYGAINTNYDYPDTLQKGALLVFPRVDCQKYKSRMTPSMFCAGDPTGNRDFCASDQGAPLAYQQQLVGIYSWGCSCGVTSTLNPPTPSSPVFNSIPFFRSWIQSNIITP